MVIKVLRIAFQPKIDFALKPYYSRKRNWRHGTSLLSTPRQNQLCPFTAGKKNEGKNRKMLCLEIIILALPLVLCLRSNRVWQIQSRRSALKSWRRIHEIPKVAAICHMAERPSWPIRLFSVEHNQAEVDHWQTHRQVDWFQLALINN